MTNNLLMIRRLLVLLLCVFGLSMTYAQNEENPDPDPDPDPTPVVTDFIYWSTDFEDLEENLTWVMSNGQCANRWYIDVPSGLTSKALFISSDANTKIKSYNKSAVSVVSVSKTFELFDNDSLSIQFDLSILGESNKDYLKVFLVPEDVEFEAATDLSAVPYAAANYSNYAFKFGDNYYINSLSEDATVVSAKIKNPAKNEKVKLVFVWVNDESYGNDPAAIIDNLVLVGDDIIFQTICNDSTTFDSDGKAISETGMHTILYYQDNLPTTQDIYFTVISQDTTIVEATICANEVYKLNGFNQSNEGEYTQKLTGINGCDSVVILKLSVNDTSINEVFDTICQAELPYEWNGLTLAKSGVYSTDGILGLELKTEKGCDSTVILHLTVDTVTFITLDTSICWNETFVFNNIEANETGTYYDTVLTTKWNEDVFECIDTINVFNLTVLPNLSKEVFDTVCYDSTYIYEYVDYDGETKQHTPYVEMKSSKDISVPYQAEIHTPEGDDILCDVTDVIHVFVREKIDTAFNDTICFGSAYHYGTHDTLLISENGGEEFIIYDTVKSLLCDCDSTIQINLYVLPKIDTTLIEGDYCFNDTVKYGTKEFVCNVEGEFEDADTIASVLYPDCDSVIQVKINVFPKVEDGFIDTTICYHGVYTHDSVEEPYSFADSDTTIWMDTLYLHNDNGCDSTVYLTIHILENPSVAVYDTICYDSIYTYNYTDIDGEQTTSWANKKESFEKTVTYNVKTITANGGEVVCSRTDTLYIAVREKIEETIYDTICFGEPYNFAGKDTAFDIEEGDIVIDLFDTVKSELCDCDSVVTMKLYIAPKPEVILVEKTICFGDSVLYGPEDNNVHYYSVDDTTYNDSLFVQSVLGCDSVIYVENIVVLPKVEDAFVTATICADSVFEFEYDYYDENGKEVTDTKVYNFLDTIGILFDTLYVKNINGCDSTIYLQIDVKQVYDTSIYDTICNNEVYILNGIEYTLDGKYEQYLTTEDNGCDSLVRLFLTVNKISSTTFDINLCEGESYTENNFDENTTGVYIQELQNVNGCDSTVTLNLTINPVYNDTIFAEQCYGTLYQDNGFTVSEQGVYTHEYITDEGCDSTVTLVLNILDVDTVIDAIICSGDSYLQNGFNAKETGTYKRYLKTQSGCDSTVTLNLTVIEPIVTNLSATICQGTTYNQNGFNVATAGKHVVIYESQYGCDSTVILNLSINPIYDTTITAEICSGEIYNKNGFIKSATGVYTKDLYTIDGCDSTVTLVLKVKDLSTTLSATICEGETYNQNGFSASKTGQYSRTVETDQGCDSLVILNLTVNPAYDTVINAEICEGQTYTQNGFSVATAGTYSQELQTINGCDSTVTLNLVVNSSVIKNINASICEGETYTDYGFSATKTGTFTKQFTSYKGCDSTLMLNLTVNPVYDTTINAEIWYGDLYDQYGFLASDNGTYVQNKQSVNGCDSVLTLNLTVKSSVETTINASICQGETYTQNGFNESTAGTYKQTLTNFKGLDSVVTLVLKVNPVYNKTLTASICQGETYNQNGFNKNTAGTYVKNLKSVNGCDSVVTLTLTVNPKFDTTISAEICSGESYKQNGFNQSTTGTYTKTLKTKNGCDSVIVLNLVVNPAYDTTINATICEGGTYTLNGFNESVQGTYTQNLTSVKGCDSTVKLNLTVAPLYDTEIEAAICEGETYEENGFTQTESGEYQLDLKSVNGCDSVVHLTLTVYPKAEITIYDTIESAETAEDYETTAIDTLQTENGCDSVVTTITYYHFTSGLLAVESSLNLTLYPNPAKDVVTIKSEGRVLDGEIVIVDNIGHIIKTIKPENGATQVNIDVSDLQTGIYYVRMGKQNRKLIVK